MVVAYKNKEDIAACYARLCNVPELQLIIIVDNSYGEVGSCLDYAGIFTTDDRTFHVVPPSNLGYAGGNNFGIEVAKHEGANHILVCNPDVLIDKGTVSSLLDEMKSRSVDLISPRLLEKDSAGIDIIMDNPGWDSYFGRGVVQIPNGRSSSRYVSTFYGACFLATTRLLESIGGLCDDFFLYGEEIDYTLRINRSKLQWAISTMNIVSHGRGSSISPGRGGKSTVAYFHAARSSVIVGRKYWPRAMCGWIAARLFLAGYSVARGRVSESRAIVGGLLRGVRAPLAD